MKTDQIKIETSDELKIPYVRLERCSLEEINGYKLKPERNAYYLIESSSEELNEEEGDRNMLSLDFVTIFDDNEKLYRSYVLLERLSPNDIDHFSSNEDSTEEQI